jgi:NADPH-dependent 2,4-dienoyl-CoA reductase/sulfur reductase-like enzyme/nitrite reductase/ring-hydroxylating ferredoxin subunit
MSGDTQELTGPDLALGVEPEAVPDGGMLVGHAHGEAVVLARRGADVFAVGAKCTHYGAPLGDGIVVGDELRCPWHHAAFSLRTGAAIRAPALEPVACFDVSTRGGKLVVTGRRGPLTVKLGGGGPSSVVIVGAGAAGSACAETLRRSGYARPLTLVGAEATPPVDRPNLSKDYLAGTAPEEWMTLRDEDFFKRNGVQLHLGTRVTRIDTANQRVHLEGVGEREYGALVLATGAQPSRLTIPGADLPHVFTLRTLADSRAIVARAATARRAVVVGASFIGLEVAASLRARGLDVHVVAPEQVPLARVLGDAVGAMVRKVHEEHGVTFHLGTVPATIDATGVTLASGQRLEADLVVVGVGVRPDVALAEGAGLTVERGIVVDEQLRASAKGVWAVGDVARWPDPRTGQMVRIEHWVVAERMGQIAARSILGGNPRCDIVPFFWSAHHGVTVNYVGHAESWDRVDIAGSLDARDAAIAYRKGERTLAVATVGRDHAALEAERAMEQGDEKALRALVPA